VEVTLVSLNTTNNLTYGVDLGYIDNDPGHKVLRFNSFGLSTVDPSSGITALAPGTGFNGIVLKPDHFAVVVQALAKDSGSRIMSAPRVLVNDNATGTLASVAEEPFTSVNASDTVSTTSFAGYASAGTTITVTPHISEDDYLQVKYGVTVNSFTSTPLASSGIPPARQTDTVTSEITVPNGYAVVVGGLTQSSKSLTESKVPFLGDIPILGLGFGTRAYAESKSTLFVFIRPVILRDDKFQDLKNLSREELLRAEIPTIYPVSEPIIIR
jgi:general secretion pathway protein D